MFSETKTINYAPIYDENKNEGIADIFDQKNEKVQSPIAEDDHNEIKSRKRFFSLLHTIFYICRVAGFRIEGRITMRDLRTGKVWK